MTELTAPQWNLVGDWLMQRWQENCHFPDHIKRLGHAVEFLELQSPKLVALANRALAASKPIASAPPPVPPMKAPAAAPSAPVSDPVAGCRAEGGTSAAAVQLLAREGLGSRELSAHIDNCDPCTALYEATIAEPHERSSAAAKRY